MAHLYNTSDYESQTIMQFVSSQDVIEVVFDPVSLSLLLSFMLWFCDTTTQVCFGGCCRVLLFCMLNTL